MHPGGLDIKAKHTPKVLVYLYCGIFRAVLMFNPNSGVGEKGCFYSNARRPEHSQIVLSIVTLIR